MLRRVCAAGCALILSTAPQAAEPQGAAPLHSEYLMTLYAPLEAPSAINDSLAIYNVAAQGGWVRGPRIHGVLVPPGGDWSRVMPSGAQRLDVRLTVRTDDGALIYVAYAGVERDRPSSAQAPAGTVL